MKKRFALAAALAAALTPVAAWSMDMPMAALAVMRSLATTADSVDAMTTGSISAQSRLGFPADPGRDLTSIEGAAYHGLIALYAAENGVPVDLARAVIQVESNYRPNAHGSAGEVGLMQIKPATARGMGFRGSVAALYGPETNIRFGMKYLGKAHRLGGGSTCRTILKYNAGHAAKRMNPVSRAYCGKVMRLMAMD